MDPLGLGLLGLIGAAIGKSESRKADKRYDEVIAESAKFSNSCINNEIRKRLADGFQFTAISDLNFIETRIKDTKESVAYANGGFALEPDVKRLITDLRKEAIKELEKKREYNLTMAERAKYDDNAVFDSDHYLNLAKFNQEDIEKIKRNIQNNIF